MQQPTRLISTPFAQEGEKTQIQNVTGEFDNSATYRLGFPPLTMQSIRLGGKPPKGTDFNGVLFDITENISFLCKGGRYQYNAGLSTLIGGYPEGSNLLLDDNVTEVVSTVAGNQNNPNIDMTGWILKPNKTTAANVADASGETQQQVNYNGGSKWHSRVGGYLENERVVLTNGDIVKSTVANNTNNPNIDTTGWINASNASLITDDAGNRVASVNVENIADLLNVSFAKSAFVRSHHDGNRLGTGIFNWSATTSKSIHDGGRVVDPLKISEMPTDWTSSAQVTSWLTASNTGEGCWVRDQSHIPTIFDYGFTPNSLAHNATNTLLFQKLVDNNIVSRIPVYDAPLYVTSGINIKNGRRIVGDSEYMNEPLIADPDRGLLGSGTGTMFTTGTYPATANTNREIRLDNIKARNSNYPVIDLFHSDDAKLYDCVMYTSEKPAVRGRFSARVSIRGGRYASTFAAFSPENFSIQFYDNCNGTIISPDTIISGGTNGGCVDVAQSQDVSLDGIYESNGGFGYRIAGYYGADLPAWQPSTAYTKGTEIRNSVNAYVCLVDHTSSAAFSTDASKWKIISGNCNAVSLNGYFEATNRPISIGANNNVLGCTIGGSRLFIGATNAENPLYVLQIGAVSGLEIGGGFSVIKKGVEPTLDLIQPTSGGTITDYLVNSSIKFLHVQGAGADFNNGLTSPDTIGYVFGRNEIKLSRTGLSSGQVREFISPVIAANVGLALSAFIIDTGNGGVIDAIEVINAAGTLGCTVRVGHSTANGENLIIDPSTLTLSNGAAATTLASPLIRPAKQQTITVVAGSGTGSFRVRIKYRM